MSADSADDIQAAEDFASRAVAAIEDALALTRHQEVHEAIGLALERTDGLDAVVRWRRTRLNLLGVVEAWSGYCRPMCQAHGEGREACEDDDPDCCGCPCHDGDPDEEEPPVPSDDIAGDAVDDEGGMSEWRTMDLP